MKLRAPEFDDAQAVSAVLIARNRLDLGVPDNTLDHLLDEWRESELDLAADAQVIEADGVIAAYAVVRQLGTQAAVDPAFEGRGIGARLLRWAEARERERGHEHHRQWIAASNERGQALLRAAGYDQVRSNWRMVLPLEHHAHASVTPTDVRLRPVDVDRDAAAMHAVDAASFAGASDYAPCSLRAFREEHLDAHDFDPELSRVAEFGDRMLGFLLARRWTDEPVGFVDILAVHPDHHRHGLGTVLLRDAFSRFAAAGLREAQLGVSSDNPRALRLYERVGMAPRFRFNIYQRPLRVT